jgi:sugar lactone lactonase YvrE
MPDGSSSVFVDGAPLSRPNGVAFDPEGNIVVVNVESADIHTFSPSGELLSTRQSLDPGNDGLVILEDGTMYVSSVR